MSIGISDTYTSSVRNDDEAPVTLLIVSAPTTSGYTDMGWA